MYPPGFTPDKDQPDLSGFTPDEPEKPALKPADSSFASSAYHAAMDPLLNRIKINNTQVYDPEYAANYYDDPNAKAGDQARIPSFVPYIGGGTYRSLGAGLLQGAGNVVGSLSSPLNLATMGAFKGAGTLAESAPAAARGLRYAGGALSAPVAAHGAYTVATAPTIGEKLFGAAETAGGVAGMRGAMRPQVKGALAPEAMTPEVGNWPEAPSRPSGPRLLSEGTPASRMRPTGTYYGGEAGLAAPHSYNFDMGPNPDILSGTVPPAQFGELTQISPQLAAQHGTAPGRPITAEEVNANMVKARQRADQIIKSGPEPLLKPDEILFAKQRYYELVDKGTNGTITPQEIQEGMKLDKKLREVNFGETGTKEPAAPQEPNPIPEFGLQPVRETQLQYKEPNPAYPGNVRVSEAPDYSPEAMRARGVIPAEPEPQPEPEPQQPLPVIDAQYEEGFTPDDNAINEPPSTGMQPGVNLPAGIHGPRIENGIRQPGEEYPGFKGRVSNAEAAASEATPEDIAAAQGPSPTSGFGGAVRKFIKGTEGSFSTDVFHKMLTGNEPSPEQIGEVSTGESKPAKPANLLTKLANFGSMSTRTRLGFHIPGTAISFHGVNEAIRHTIYGESANPIKTGQRAIEAINFLVRPWKANEYLKANPHEVSEARMGGVTNETTDIGRSFFNNSNVLKRGFNYLTDPKPLFGMVIPALKTKTYIRIFDNLHDRGMPLQEARSKAGMATNNIYAGMNLRLLERNPITQKVFRAAAMAPDWMESNMRLGAGMAKSIMNPKDPAYTAYRTGVINFLGAYVTMNVLNAINNDGKFSFQNDPGHELDVAIGQDDDGRVRYWRPFGTAMDMIRIPLELAHSAIEGGVGGFGKALADTTRSRASLPIQFVTDMMSNTTWKGDPIFGRNKYGQEMGLAHQGYNFANDVLSHFSPTPVSAGADYMLGKTSGEEAITQGLQLPFGYKKPEQPAKKQEKKWKY